jgi:DNA-binding transcriptional LysR family regulator
MLAGMEQIQAEPVQRPASAGTGAPQGIELRHLRYFVALADAGSFTHAAERIFIAQPTLSHQIRRLEEIVGTPLLQRRREGLRLTPAGSVLLDASRNVLSLVDHEVSRTRQAAGLGRPRLRMVMPPGLPESLAVAAAAGLRAAAAVAEVDVVWLETVLDAEFSLIGTHRADAGLGWLTAGPEALPAPLDAMILGEFEPEVWIPSCHAAARRGAISLEELAGLEVIHGPRRAHPGTFDAWAGALRAVDPRFEFTDPPFRRSLPVTLAFAATGDRPAAVLTGPATPAGAPRPIHRSRSAGTSGMVRVSIVGRPLTASAALVWSGDLPRPLQQMLFETADDLALPASLQPAELASLPVLPDAEPGRGPVRLPGRLTRRRARASRARIAAAADATRRQIERDLHDGAQQRLVSLVLQLRAARADVPSGAGLLSARLDQVAAGLAGW